MKKILIISLIAIPLILWGIWLVFPKTSIQSIMEGSVNSDKLGVEVKGLKKGLFYNLTVDRLTLKSSGDEQVSLNNIYGCINPLNFIMLRFTMLDDTGHVEFVTKDSRLEPAILSGVNVPLNFFNSVRGSVDIKGDIINVVSIALEGKDIHARLKGPIKDAVMNLDMELMPGISLIENPLFRGELGKYKVSPGYYVIPLKGNL